MLKKLNLLKYIFILMFFLFSCSNTKQENTESKTAVNDNGDYYNLHIIFDTVSGLTEGGNVLINNERAGAVSEISLYENKVKVTVKLLKNKTVYENSEISIKLDETAQKPVIIITHPQDKKKKLVEDDTAQGKDSIAANEEPLPGFIF